MQQGRPTGPFEKESRSHNCPMKPLRCGRVTAWPSCAWMTSELMMVGCREEQAPEDNDSSMLGGRGEMITEQSASGATWASGLCKQVCNGVLTAY